MTAHLALGDGVVALGPYLQNVTPKSMVIMRETSVPMESHIAYWSPAQEKQYLTGPPLVMRHETLLDDLEPNTVYSYSVILQGKEVFEECPMAKWGVAGGLRFPSTFEIGHSIFDIRFAVTQA